VARVPEPLVETFARARELGFLGPGPVENQIMHSLDLLGASEEVLGSTLTGALLDLGSGGGIPGLVFASERLGLGGALLDAHARRCSFLADAVHRLGFDARFRVRCGRAELLARERELRGTFDFVVARGFGGPAVTAECAAGFLRLGGHLIVSEPPPPKTFGGWESAARWDEPGLERLGYAPPGFGRVGDATAAVMTLVLPSAEWPRRSGVPAKRPVWR
jgi:16S rRNA (guanine527-N7)-methyltransferase